jgi:hypothetical protein
LGLLAKFGVVLFRSISSARFCAPAESMFKKLTAGLAAFGAGLHVCIGHSSGVFEGSLGNAACRAKKLAPAGGKR